MIMNILNLFPTQLYRAVDADLFRQNSEFESEIKRLRANDLKTVTNQDLLNLYKWEEYTSYFTNKQLFKQDWFKPLINKFEFHVNKYIEVLGIDLGFNKIQVTECFANIMDRPYHCHGKHIHTGAAFSGVYYVRADEGSGAITFEDPAFDHLMYQFKYKQDSLENVSEIHIVPKPGELVIFPGHLPHKVEQSHQEATRIAISFNFVLANA